MAQPVYTPPSFPPPPRGSAPAQPPAPPRRAGLSSGAKAGLALAFLFALVTMGVISYAVVRVVTASPLVRPGGSAAARQIARQLDDVDPYTLVSREFRRNPAQFRVGAVRGAEVSIRRNVPNGRMTVDDSAVITDLGIALRTIINYHGEIATPNGPATVDGQTRQYTHKTGAVVIEAVCVTSSTTCSGRDDLLDGMDTIVLEHMADDDVEGLLPRGADCEPQVLRAPGRIRRAQLCRVPGGLVLTVMKLNLPETREEARTILQDPEMQGPAGREREMP